jgi:hypothetical protein
MTTRNLGATVPIMRTSVFLHAARRYAKHEGGQKCGSATKKYGRRWIGADWGAGREGELVNRAYLDKMAEAARLPGLERGASVASGTAIPTG